MQQLAGEWAWTTWVEPGQQCDKLDGIAVADTNAIIWLQLIANTWLKADYSTLQNNTATTQLDSDAIRMDLDATNSS